MKIAIAEEVVVSEMQDIGPLDAVCLGATAVREKFKMKTVCDLCRRKIQASTDLKFVIAMKAGHKNMLFHISCLDSDARAMLDAFEERQKIKKGQTNGLSKR